MRARHVQPEQPWFARARRDRQYAADVAIEQAISQVRFVGGPALAACALADDSTVDTLNGIAIRVDWRNSCGVVRGSDGTVVANATSSSRPA